MEEDPEKGVGEPDLSVVIPTRNRSGLLRTTLQNLAESTFHRPWEIVVVANACTDDTATVVAEMAARYDVPIRFVEGSRPSASVARNTGAQAAAAPLLVFLDDDILVSPGTLTMISEWYGASDRHSLLVGQVLPLPEHLATPFGAFRQRVLGDVSPKTQPIDVDWYASNIAAVPSGIFNDLGGYDESYPAATYEDTDFAIRACRSQYRIVFHPAVVGMHNDWAGTTARDYCRRTAIQTATAPLLAERFPDNDHPWKRVLEVNRPPDASDTMGMRVQKRMKQAGIAVAADRWLPICADAVVLPRRPRELLYRACLSLAMFGGYQRGLRARASSGRSR